MRKILAILATLLVMASQAHARTPAPVSLQTLYESADIVALVTVNRGRTVAPEGLSCGAVYTGEVEEGFKGVPPESEIEFGRYHGLRMGHTYLLFLKNLDRQKPFFASRDDENAEYAQNCLNHIVGPQIMHHGFGALEIENPSILKFQPGVQIPIRFIPLPSELDQISSTEEACEMLSECVWVTKEHLSSWLKAQRGAP